MITQTLNVTDVWKPIPNFGSTTYVNISDGTVRVVPWGSLVWFGEVVSWAVMSGVIYLGLKYIFKF